MDRLPEGLGEPLSVEGLLADETKRRALFPVTAERIYLAHAAVSPLPAGVADSVGRYVTSSQKDDQEKAAGNVEEATRLLAAQFLGVPGAEVALLGPTSNALSLVAMGFPFDEGDNVVIYRDDYPSNVYPWLSLRGRGVEVRSVQAPSLGRIGIDQILAEVDSRTRLVALASCHFLSGVRLDLDEIGAALRMRGIAFCVDGIQSLGAFPLSLEYVDFMAADAHKWLLGPCAAGVLYVRRAWQDRLGVSQWGWHNVACPGFVAQDELQIRDDAARYEAGTANLMGLVGLQAAMRLLLHFGVERIGRELLQKRTFLREGLLRAGYSVLGDGNSETCLGGMISATRQDLDMEKVFTRLAEARIHASLRHDREGRAWLRFSPHFYNSRDELTTALECL